MRLLALFTLLVCLLPAQESVNVTAEVVSTGHSFVEGPLYNKQGFLLFSDVPKNLILQLRPGQKATEYRAESQGANGNAYDAQGRLYTCESRTRRVVRQNRSGKLEVLAERYEGKRLNAPNDIVVRRDGHAYFTDPAFGTQQQGRELDFYGVYHLGPNGALELIAKPTGRPNGIALTADGKTLYVANSDEKNVVAYDLDSSGKASGERTVVEGIDGVPDGLKVDEKGNLYVTCKGVAIYSPEGKLLQMISLPETPANCAFGDADGKTLYITAQTSVYRIRLSVKGALQN